MSHFRREYFSLSLPWEPKMLLSLRWLKFSFAVLCGLHFFLFDNYRYWPLLISNLMHVQPIIEICNAKQSRQIYQYKSRILCIKLEINQGYAMMHVQPIIKIFNAKQARQIYQYKSRILCIKLEINQGYTMMHGQSIIKIWFCCFIQADDMFRPLF